MAQTTNKYGIYKTDRTKFGGIIYPSDFYTEHRGNNNIRGSQIAARIERDAMREEKLYKEHHS